MQHNKKRVVIESTIHKALKLIAVEKEVDLQDLIHFALDLFINECGKEAMKVLVDMQDSQNKTGGIDA